MAPVRTVYEKRLKKNSFHFSIVSYLRFAFPPSAGATSEAFQEAPAPFLPRVDTDSDIYHNTKRTPSYTRIRPDLFHAWSVHCVFLPVHPVNVSRDVISLLQDRILFKRRYDEDTNVVKYTSCTNMKMSDHRPVFRKSKSSLAEMSKSHIVL